jgi:hypothetical protein
LALSGGECQRAGMIRKLRESSRVVGTPVTGVPGVQPGSSYARLVPISGEMRTLGFRTHVLLAMVAAAGVVASLKLPWYGPHGGAAAALGMDGPIERTLAEVGRAVSATAGTSGWTALGTWATPLAVLAALAALTSALCLAPSAYGTAREGARLGGLAVAALVAWKLLDHPGELRHGALVAAGSALVLVASSFSVAGARR